MDHETQIEASEEGECSVDEQVVASASSPEPIEVGNHRTSPRQDPEEIMPTKKPADPDGMYLTSEYADDDHRNPYSDFYQGTIQKYRNRSAATETKDDKEQPSCYLEKSTSTMDLSIYDESSDEEMGISALSSPDKDDSHPLEYVDLGNEHEKGATKAFVGHIIEEPPMIEVFTADDTPVARRRMKHFFEFGILVVFMMLFGLIACYLVRSQNWVGARGNWNQQSLPIHINRTP